MGRQRIMSGANSTSLPDSAFKSFFYPLPASWQIGSLPSSGLCRFDMRTVGKEDAINSRYFVDQMNAVPGCDIDVNRGFATMITDLHGDEHIHTPLFRRFNGQKRGEVLYQMPIASPMSNSISVAFKDVQFRLSSFNQEILLFSTKRDASRFLETALERDMLVHLITSLNPVSYERDGAMSKELECAVHKDCAPSGIQHVNVFKGSHDGRSLTLATRSRLPVAYVSATVVAVISLCYVQLEFMVTEYAYNVNEGDFCSGVVAVATEALLHLYHQTTGYRNNTSKALLMKDIGTGGQFFALNLCTFCGKRRPTTRCSGCRIEHGAKYCSQSCQSRHWKMTGPFAHKHTCTRLDKAGRPADQSLPVSPGSKVSIIGLTSTAGQALNGNSALVLSKATTDARVVVILLKELAAIENTQEYDYAIPDGKKRLIKVENLCPI